MIGRRPAGPAVPVALDRRRLEAVAEQLGERLSPEEIDALARFTELFFKWNAHINLSSVESGADFLDSHLVDALAARRFVDGGVRAVDVGSGGGLPAIPLAILAPGLRLDLIEPTAKKVAFLRTCVREIGLGNRLRVDARRLATARGDEAVRGAAPTYDLAMSRATFAPAVWLSLGMQLVRAGGQVLVFGVVGAEDELPAAAGEVRYGRGRRLSMFRRP